MRGKRKRTIKSPAKEGTRTKEQIRKVVIKAPSMRATAEALRKKTYHPKEEK